MVDLERAQAAKLRAATLLAEHVAVNGVGVCRVADGYGLRVDLREPCDPADLPAQVDGVPVTTRLVGPAAAQDG